MNPTLFFYTFGFSGGSVQLAPADDEREGGEQLTAASIPDEVVQQYLLAAAEEQDEAMVPPAYDLDAEAAFTVMAEGIEAAGGAVISSFEGEAFGTDGGDLLMGDGGIDAAVIAELLASLAADLGA